MSSKTSSKYSAPALEKGLDILEFLSSTSSPQTQSELMHALDRSQSEIYRMLECLVAREFVAKNESTGAYSLTLKLYALSHRHNRTSLIRRIAAQPMEKLAEATGQSCHLSLQHGGEVLVIMERLPLRTVCLSIGEGSTLSLSRTASGIKFLSALPDQEQRLQALSQDQSYLALSEGKQGELLNRIAALEDETVQLSPSEFTPGGFDIATTIGLPATDTFGVLALSFLEGTPDLKFREKLKEQLLETARTIDQHLGLSL